MNTNSNHLCQPTLKKKSSRRYTCLHKDEELKFSNWNCQVIRTGMDPVARHQFPSPGIIYGHSIVLVYR